MEFKYLVIEGPIGVGKTTLTEKLAGLFHCTTLLDESLGNPHLERFYAGESGAAFKTQLHFLAERATRLKELTDHFPRKQRVISDFLLEKDRIFAHCILDDQELGIYKKLFDAVSCSLVKPDLVVFLKASVDRIMERIAGRGIPMERTVTRRYIKDLGEAFEHFFVRYMQQTNVPVLVVETSQVNFATSTDDLTALADFLKQKTVIGLQYYIPAGKVSS